METVDSENTFATSISTSPVLFINPLRTLSPVFASRGSDSPVSAEVSKAEFPFIILPSKGTFSPGFTTIMSATFISSGFTFFIPLSVLRFA